MTEHLIVPTTEFSNIPTPATNLEGEARMLVSYLQMAATTLWPRNPDAAEGLKATSRRLEATILGSDPQDFNTCLLALENAGSAIRYSLSKTSNMAAITDLVTAHDHFSQASLALDGLRYFRHTVHVALGKRVA